jgi:putative spermidine/putrescine transport system permease protein
MRGAARGETAGGRYAARALSVYVGIACLVLIIPIAILVIVAFGEESYMRFPPQSWSLRWFAAFFGDPRWRHALGSSLVIASVACVIATVTGFCAAYAFVRSDLRAKKLVLSFMLLPIIIPQVITAIAMYFVSAPLGLVGNVFWIGVCHAVIALPIVLLILLSALQGVDVNYERAALSLGCSRLRMFTHVVIPLALPGILSAALFAFLASFDELIIALFLAGVRSETLPVRIWNSLHLQVEPVIAAVSAFLIGVTGLVLLLDAAVRQLRARGPAHAR